jgi:hypothetical protein
VKAKRNGMLGTDQRRGQGDFYGFDPEGRVCLETGVVPDSATVTRLSLKRGNDWLQATRGFAH